MLHKVVRKSTANIDKRYAIIYIASRNIFRPLPLLNVECIDGNCQVSPQLCLIFVYKVVQSTSKDIPVERETLVYLYRNVCHTAFIIHANFMTTVMAPVEQWSTERQSLMNCHYVSSNSL